MKPITEQAPAKVNLVLKVLGKRPDGYHEIHTIFERVRICDIITFSQTDAGIAIECSDPEVPSNHENICYKAAQALIDRFNIEKGVSIAIEKHIPVAAGLGGGSSDAASTIKALNQIWDLRLNTETMIDIAGEIGADIPFFLMDTPFAEGKGKGGDLRIIGTASKLWHLVVTPDIKLRAGDVYARYSKTHSLPLTSMPPIDTILDPIYNIYNMGRLNTFLHNDLENVVLAFDPIIKYIKEALSSSGGSKAIVSGSGPSVFSVYNSKDDALRAMEIVNKALKREQRHKIFTAETY